MTVTFVQITDFIRFAVRCWRLRDDEEDVGKKQLDLPTVDNDLPKNHASKYHASKKIMTLWENYENNIEKIMKIMAASALQRRAVNLFSRVFEREISD